MSAAWWERYTSGATITASYATGSADGGAAIVDRVGGLVGQTNEAALSPQAMLLATLTGEMGVC